VARELRDILALWRGPVLGGVIDGTAARAGATRYEELRLAALDLLYDCELRSGNHAAVIPELRDMVARHVFKERFYQQLMIALYRSGRQSEALAVYRDLSRRLTDELGLEPSPTMREYERAILDQDPALELPRTGQLPSVDEGATPLAWDPA
jgi:DNA-binding SARP family transcriptional activator